MFGYDPRANFTYLKRSVVMRQRRSSLACIDELTNSSASSASPSWPRQRPRRSTFVKSALVSRGHVARNLATELKTRPRSASLKLCGAFF